MTSGELNARIRLALCAAQASLHTTAEAMNIDTMDLTRIIRGERRISSLELALLSDHLRIPVNYFLHNPGDEGY